MPRTIHYTRVVTFWKYFLWSLVAGVIGLMIWIATDDTEASKKRLVFTNVPQMGNIQNVMENPRYQGLDEHNRPYTVIADRAIQLDEEHIALENIRADMLQEDGTWLALHSREGRMDTEERRLDLEGDVTLFYEEGYEMRTARAHVDIRKGAAYGDAHVEGQGPPGTLEAESFEVEKRGKVIRFRKDVKMRLYNDK